jgi:hypothetical protein
MKHYDVELISQEIVTGMECDVCHKAHRIGYVHDESIPEYNKRQVEVNEFFTICHDCGYGSVFEDGLEIELHICQHCMNNLLGEIIRKEMEYKNET